MVVQIWRARHGVSRVSMELNEREARSLHEVAVVNQMSDAQALAVCLKALLSFDEVEDA